MAHDKEEDKFSKAEGIGGYQLANLFNNAPFISSKSKVVNLSFDIHDIVEINDSEILKLKLFNGLIVRIMKYNNSENQPSAKFDIVDDVKKQIVAKTNKDYVGGLGISFDFFKLNYITQWEVPILEKLCRGFVLGDPEAIRNLIENYHLKISKESEWNIKMKLGIK